VAALQSACQYHAVCVFTLMTHAGVKCVGIAPMASCDTIHLLMRYGRTIDSVSSHGMVGNTRILAGTIPANRPEYLQTRLPMADIRCQTTHSRQPHPTTKDTTMAINYATARHTANNTTAPWFGRDDSEPLVTGGFLTVGDKRTQTANTLQKARQPLQPRKRSVVMNPVLRDELQARLDLALGRVGR